mmetsp:Transcript_40115/g.78629  ORF Transcript_40115/g.78629 Transcript_40115/m.78629 type:complete len:228 (+) Transcript_40115:359-1042(+)
MPTSRGGSPSSMGCCRNARRSLTPSRSTSCTPATPAGWGQRDPGAPSGRRAMRDLKAREDPPDHPETQAPTEQWACLDRRDLPGRRVVSGLRALPGLRESGGSQVWRARQAMLASPAPRAPPSRVWVPPVPPALRAPLAPWAPPVSPAPRGLRALRRPATWLLRPSWLAAALRPQASWQWGLRCTARPRLRPASRSRACLRSSAGSPTSSPRAPGTHRGGRMSCSLT